MIGVIRLWVGGCYAGCFVAILGAFAALARRLVVRRIASCLILLLFGGIETTRVYAQSKDNVIQMIRAQRQLGANLEFKYDYNLEILHSDPVINLDNAMRKLRVQIKYMGNKQFLEYEAWGAAGQPSIRDLRVHNGKVSKNYMAHGGNGIVFKFRDEWVAKHNYVFDSIMWPTEPYAAPVLPEIEDPALAAQVIEADRAGTDLVELIRHAKTVLRPERLNGTETLVVDGNDGNITVWLDPESGAIPRKSELRYGSKEAHLVERMEVESVHEVDGFFFPAKVVRSVFASRENKPEMLNQVVARFVYEVPRDAIKVGQLVDADFEYQFPERTFVFDEASGLEYTIGASGREVVLDSALGDIDPANSETGWGTPRIWAIASIGLVCLVAVVRWLRRRRARVNA